MNETQVRPVQTQYEDMMRFIRDHGRYKGDRTGTGTKSIFGYQLRYNLQHGFPLITTKKVATKPMVTELLWFLKGDTNIGYLHEHGCHIWDEWADKDGNLGPVYGAQWRAWPGKFAVMQTASMASPERQLPDGARDVVNIVGQTGDLHTIYQEPIDQIEWVVNRLKTNPDCRRIIVSAWNVAELPKMALMPCHALFQFYTHELTLKERQDLYLTDEPQPDYAAETDEAVMQHLHKFLDEQGVPRRALSCQLYQRSCDTFLGVPFNIASYALLTHMIAQQVGMAVGDFIWTGGDVHLYSNHGEQVDLQLSRVSEAYPFPTLKLRKANSIFEYTHDDIEFVNYQHHPAIKAPVAV